MTGAAIRLGAVRTRAVGRWVHEMQGLVAHLPGSLPRVAVLAGSLLESTHRGIPIQTQDALALASFDQHFESPHGHDQLQGLDPGEFHFHGVLVFQIVDLGLILTGNGLQTLSLAGRLVAGIVTARGPCDALQRLAAKLVVVLEEPIEVAVQAPAHAAREGLELTSHPLRQRAAKELYLLLPVPIRGTLEPWRQLVRPALRLSDRGRSGIFRMPPGRLNPIHL